MGKKHRAKQAIALQGCGKALMTTVNLLPEAQRLIWTKYIDWKVAAMVKDAEEASANWVKTNGG